MTAPAAAEGVAPLVPMSHHYPYPFADLSRINRWLGWLLLPPALMTLTGLLHSLYSYALLTGLPAELPLAVLASAMQRTLRHDDLLRLAQISLTLLFILFFCVAWLYLAFRNLAALAETPPRSLRSCVFIHLHIWGHLLFALRLLQRLWRESSPTGQDRRIDRWLLHWWWGALLGANVCKVIALLLLRAPLQVGQWREGCLWMLAAYGLYLTLFVLTWRLALRLEILQRHRWQQRGAGPAAMAPPPFAGPV